MFSFSLPLSPIILPLFCLSFFFFSSPPLSPSDHWLLEEPALWSSIPTLWSSISTLWSSIPTLAPLLSTLHASLSASFLNYNLDSVLLLKTQQWLFIDPSESESRSVMSNFLRVHGILQARILEWVACPFSRRSSWPRNRTGISCIAGRFLTNWPIREASSYLG